MVKYVSNKIMKRVNPVALAILGWLCFICGAVLELPITLKLLLMSAARVLP